MFYPWSLHQYLTLLFLGNNLLAAKVLPHFHAASLVKMHRSFPERLRCLMTRSLKGDTDHYYYYLKAHGERKCHLSQLFINVSGLLSIIQEALYWIGSYKSK